MNNTKIIGNTTATPMIVPDLAQTDPKKADFVKNKRVSELVNDMGYLTKEDIGDIGGGANITIDTKMSDTSENAVQNKVIKHYVDDTTGNKNDLYTRDKYTLVDAINEVYIANDNKADKTLVNVDDATFKKKAEQAGIGGENIPTKLSDLEDDSFDKPINASTYSNYATMDDYGNIIWVHYATRDELDPTIFNITEPNAECQFSYSYRHPEWRAKELTSLSFDFNDGIYPDAYMAGLVFDSGETPTLVNYVIPENPSEKTMIQWTGVDCVNSSYVNSEGQTVPISVFQPSPNTHYNITFFFDGTYFIGLVHGFVPAGGNVVSE